MNGNLQLIRDFVGHLYNIKIVALSDRVREFNNFEMPMAKRVEWILQSPENLDLFVKKISESHKITIK